MFFCPFYLLYLFLRLLLVKSRSENTASQILRPILNNYGLKLDTMVITVAYSNEVLPNHSSIAQANNKRLMVLTQDEFQGREGPEL